MIADNPLPEFYCYIDDVKSGDQVACEQVRAAVDRFQRDREREQSDESWPYYFDEAKAEAAIEWFPAHLRHTIGRYSTHRLVLAPWQQFGVGNIWGWRRKEDGTRRFRRVFWSMGRKNGKSTLAAAIAIYGAADDIDPITMQREATAQVILAASKREQADMVIFSEVTRMVNSCPELARPWERKYQKITFTENEGSISTVGSNKPYDGLNPSMIILDETHSWTETHRDFYNTMLTGGGSRSQPLTICTTTAGDTDSLIWFEEYLYSRKVVTGEVDDDRWFGFTFELDPEDDPLDESVWIKGNPNLGVSLSPDYLKDNAKMASQSPIALNTFKRYHCNLPVSSIESAFNMEHWDKCQGELSDWSEADVCGIGIDVGARDDLAAYAVVARFPTEELNPDKTPVYRYEVRAKTYIAHDTTRDLTKEPFATWVHEDRIRKCQFPLSEMRDDVLDECRAYYVHDVAYDPYNGQMLAEELEREGITVASMQQTQAMFNEPLQDMRQAMADGRLKHNGDPVLRWCLKNSVVSQDRQARWMLDKKSSHGKIDAAVAMAMGYRRAMVAPAATQGFPFVV